MSYIILGTDMLQSRSLFVFVFASKRYCLDDNVISFNLIVRYQYHHTLLACSILSIRYRNGNAVAKHILEFISLRCQYDL